MSPPYLARRAGLGVLLCVAMVAAAWSARDLLLAGVARLIVAEDGLAPVDVIVISNAAAAADALEAVKLYREGVSPRILYATWVSEREQAESEMRRLGIDRLSDSQLIVAILQRSGVPEDAITVLPAAVDGTETEIAAVAAYAERHPLGSLMYVTARSHTARARWLLRRQVPRGTRVAVRSPRTDGFSVASWWHSHGAAREVVTEYVRWLTTLALPNHWDRAS